MENSSTVIGPRGLIKRHELVRVIIQCLDSLGYQNSASCLELESGISHKSIEFRKLTSQILGGNWDGCVDILNGIKDLDDEIRDSVLFMVFKQYFLEYLNHGEEYLALDVFRKWVPKLRMSKEMVHNLVSSIVVASETKLDKMDGDVCELRKKLLSELEKMLPPPIVLPERRLEHLIETTITSQIDSCIYHNSSGVVSLYEDHCCGRDQIPTETVQILSEHMNEVWFVQFSNNGEYLASSSSDCTAIIWKVLENGTLTLEHTLKGHQKAVSFVAWSPDDTKLLTCGNGEVLKLWDVESGTCKHTFRDQGFPVSSCAWFPDSKRLVCGSGEPQKGIFMWDCDGNQIKAWSGTRMPKVSDLALTPNGENLISILADKDIRILNLGSNSDRVITEQHPIASLSVSRDGEFFIVNLNSEEIHMWDVAGKWKKPLKYIGHSQSKYVIRSCFGGLDCKFIASGSENCQVFIWNRQNPNPIEVLYGHSMTVNCVSWNPKRHKMLASASDDHTIRIWGPGKYSGISPESLVRKKPRT